MTSASIQQVSWGEIRTRVKSVSPELVEIIDEISPTDSYTIYLARYPFGSIIVDQGSFQIPNNKTGNIESPTSKDTPKELQDDLCYLSVPFGMVLTNSIEVYRELPERVFSVAYISADAGINMGIWEYLGDAASFSVSSGARSLYMIPSISDDNFHKKISKKFNISTLAPRTPLEHWSTFREIAYSANFPEPWYCEMLFFGKAWYENLDDTSSGWQKLKMHILEKGWRHSSIGRSRYIIDLDWYVTVKPLTENRQKINPYTLDTLRHLISIAIGALPASRPATTDEAGPISALQEIWHDDYRLKYVPTIMQPWYYDHNSDIFTYYSLSIPTLLASAPNFKNMASNIDDIRDLISLIKIMYGKSFENVKVNNIYLDEILSKTDISFFHEERFSYGDAVQATKKMPEEDVNLIYTQKNLFNGGFNHQFATSGTFCRGCVRINPVKP